MHKPLGRILFSLGAALALLTGVWQAAPAPAHAATAVGLQSDFIRVADLVMPSVVSMKASRIVTYRPAGPPEDFFRGTPWEGSFRQFGQPIQRKQVGQGSGFIIDPRGYILTNNHVVAGAQQIQVHLNDGRQVTGRVVGTDPRFDVALVQVPVQGLKPAAMGDSSRIRVGQWASATGRRGLGKGTYGDFIQTDASINPGNSGGPLLDIDGRVLGINTMIAAQAQGIGFAIPINVARKIISRWMR
jgi:serine protease Do